MVFNVSSNFLWWRRGLPTADLIVVFDSLQKSPFFVRNVEKYAILMQAVQQRKAIFDKKKVYIVVKWDKIGGRSKGLPSEESVCLTKMIWLE